MTNAQPTLAVFTNAWGLLELPQRPSTQTWSMPHCLEMSKQSGFDGCQAGVELAGAVRAVGLRFVAHARINTPTDAGEVIRAVADSGAECVTVHLGWGMEDDDEIDRLVDSTLGAAGKTGVPVFFETHRATVFQDIWRTCRAIERRPMLRFNGDFSHLYCGQEMTYRGFATSRQSLTPILQRTAFLHGRVSNVQTMQADLTDPANDAHVENFRWMWLQSMQYWLQQHSTGVFYFTPELGPPSSGYSLTRPDEQGQRIEQCDRWQQTLMLRQIAQQLWAQAMQVTQTLPGASTIE